jgi:hypothetical protein
MLSEAAANCECTIAGTAVHNELLFPCDGHQLQLFRYEYMYQNASKYAIGTDKIQIFVTALVRNPGKNLICVSRA